MTEIELKELFKYVKTCVKVAESTGSWVECFRMIFNSEVSQKVPFEWFDFDGSYEDDVRSFYQQFGWYMESVFEGFNKE